jgi:hypothetical protein
VQTLRTLARLAAAALLVGCSASSSQGSVADAGQEASIDVAAPRPVAPASASFATSGRPTFRWKLGEGTSGARVEICAERACTRVTTTFDAKGSSGSPAEDLPAGVVFWRLRGMSGASVGSPTSVTWELTVRPGSAPVSLTWGAMSDGNGDGYGDVVAGDSDAFTKTQHVYVYLGGPSGPSQVPSSVLGAPAPQLSYANSVASAGDVDGDGFPELLVGSPAEDKVYVYAGGPSGWAEPPMTILVQPTQGQDAGPTMTSFGQAVSGAGDVNGDGYADVVVGNPNREATVASPVQGGAVVYFGSATGLSPSSAVTLPTSGTSDEQDVGQFVTSAGDVDGDGLADVAIYGGLGTTDPQNVLVFMGSATSFGSTPGISLQFEGANTTWMGSANLLSCVGDVNGDGYPDLAMGTATPPNAVYEVDHVTLYYGGPTGLPPTPSRRLDSTIGTADHFGMSVAGGDFDQSGVDDVAIAIVSTATPPLVAQLYEGGPVDPALTATLTTMEGTLRYGREVGSADVDGDGYPDLIVGDPGRQTSGDGGVLHGAVLVYRGGKTGVASTPAYVLLPPDDTNVAYGASVVRP